MADMQQLERALVNADKAGDVEAARTIAGEIKRQRAMAQPGDSGQVSNVAAKGNKLGATPLDAAAFGVAQGLTFGTSDEIEAGLRSGFGLAGDYGKELDLVRRNMKASEAASPATSIVGEVLGAMLLPGKAITRGGSMLANAARGAVAGAGYGAAYGAGTAEGGAEKRAKGAIQGAAFGAAGGGLGGAIAGKIEGAAARRAARNAIPTPEAIKTGAQKAFDVAEQSGVVMAPQKFSTVVDDIATTIANEGIDKTVHPKATAALQRLIAEKDKPITLKGVHLLRRVLGGAAKSIEPDERRLASIMIDKVDDMIGDLKPADVLMGDAKGASRAFQTAMREWSKMRKAETIASAFDRAKDRAGQFSVSGMENALRTEFRQIAMNQKKMRGFTEAEQKAIREVAQGTPMRNVVRFFGKFAPRGVISGMFSAGAGAAMGPAGAIVPIVGEAANRASRRATMRAAESVDEIVRSGGMTADQIVRASRWKAGTLTPVARATGQQFIDYFAPQNPLFGLATQTKR